jgi:hypothetical protein
MNEIKFMHYPRIRRMLSPSELAKANAQLRSTACGLDWLSLKVTGERLPRVNTLISEIDQGNLFEAADLDAKTKELQLLREHLEALDAAQIRLIENIC